METHALGLVQMTVMLLLTISVSVSLMSANSVATGINLRKIFSRVRGASYNRVF